ncbi:Secondary metabolism regulator laeA [Fusarium culmorum]|uniref:Secondary metabolism regulator laeA n=1 Tax=Fusarium culmorum TaxID=5516 RepID=A0A2T4GU72_FUSCU|nr:Secondary metabolism regulator laeA [Fusarium culmorum]
MADTPDNGHDTSSLRSAGAGSIDRAMAATRLTASSSSNISNYASSVSSDNQSQSHAYSQNLTGSGSGSGGLPGTPVSRRSGGWDRQTLSPAAAARVRHDDSNNEDYAPHQSSSLRPSSELLEDSSDSSDEYVSTYKPLKTASRSKRFFQSMVNKFTKSSVRYGHLPNNQQEQDRNVIQHTVIINVFKGQLQLSPLAPRPKRALDVGTGGGIWALHPYCHVLGVDIDPVHPPYTKSNCTFKVMDITQDWDFPGGGNFDFIHIRQLGDINDKQKMIQAAFDNLRPGGWVELTEWIAILQSPDHSLDGTAFRKWNNLLEEGLQSFGATMLYPETFKSLLQKTGFEPVIDTRNGAPTNACYPGKKLQRIGHLMTQNWLLILEPLSMPVFTQGLGWTPEQVQALLAEVRREIGNTKYHSFMTLITVCAQKPWDGIPRSSSSTSATASRSESSLVQASRSGTPLPYLGDKPL